MRIAAIALTLMAMVIPARAAELDAATIALIVPAEAQGRLAEELRRELEASQFSVLSLPPRPVAGNDTRREAERLLAPGAATAGRPGGPRGLIAVIAVAEAQVTIFARPAPPADPDGAVIATPLTAEQDDRPARRRLCLAVVEHLRRLGLSSAPAAPPPPPTTPIAAPAATAPEPSVVVTTIPEAARRAWWFGAASDLNILSVRGTPTAHVTLMAERPLGEAISLAARVAWPILGAQFTDQMRFIRTWTFAGEIGGQLLLRDRAASLRPMVGTSLGVRCALADTDEFEMRTSRVMLTPALTLALNAGLRYRIRPLVDLIVATDVSQGVLLLTDRRDYEAAAARERLVRLSLGIMFEY